MKYTRPACRLLALLATFALACASPALAQSDSYATSTATLNAYNGPAASDDPQAGSLLTIHKRVDEVNVLFLATD